MYDNTPKCNDLVKLAPNCSPNDLKKYDIYRAKMYNCWDHSNRVCFMQNLALTYNIQSTF